MDPEPEMGAAAAEAAVYDTSPSLLRNPPPILAESAQPSTFDMGRLLAVLAGMENRMENNMEKKMNGMTQAMREEMQCMGAGLQDGLEEVKKGQEQLKGEMEKSMTAVKEFKIGQEELRRATCWGRLVEVTEEVTGTCTREIRHVEVTEYTETREIGERLHGVEEEEEDAHTHSGSEGQWG